MSQRLPYCLDLADPRAPSEEQWAELSESERRRVVESLPAEVPLALFMPEGDRHRKAKNSAVDALDGFFKRAGRRVYVSSELNVYYPEQPRFAPDVLAVLDVDPYDRDRWMVSSEGKGLDFVLEIHVSGDYKKDFEGNRKRYASLGIPEYFLLDRTRERLNGWRLGSPSARVYEPIVPQLGKFRSRVLDMELMLEAGRLRFGYGNARVHESDELIADLGQMVDSLVLKREAETEERERERELRQQAEQDREQAELKSQQADLKSQQADLKSQQAEQEREQAELKSQQAERERDEALRRATALEAELAELRRRL